MAVRMGSDTELTQDTAASDQLQSRTWWWKTSRVRVHSEQSFWPQTHTHTCGARVKPATSAGKTAAVVATSSAHAPTLLRLVCGAETDAVVTENLSCAAHTGAFDAILPLFPGPLSPYFVRVSVRRVSGTPSIFSNWYITDGTAIVSCCTVVVVLTCRTIAWSKGK